MLRTQIIGKIYCLRNTGEHLSIDINFHRENYIYTMFFLAINNRRETVEELKERRSKWSRSRLEAGGLCLFDAAAEPEAELFGEKIVKIVKFGGNLRDRFTKGDVLVLTPETVFGGHDPIPRESLVVDVGKDWMSLAVGSTWPSGLWEMRRTSGAFLVRIDRTASQAPLKAQIQALDRLRKNRAGDSALLMANLFANSTDFVASTSQVPAHFCPENLEEQVLQSIEDVTKSTAFKPNQSQKDAIAWSLQRRISLIRGPPGTGKTRVAALMIATALKLKMKNLSDEGNDNEVEKVHPRILAVTHSNGAADVLLEGLLQVG